MPSQEQPEHITAATPEAPPNFYEHAAAQYAAARIAVERNISTGKLPETYRLSEALGGFTDRLTALSPIHTAMQAQGWQPEVIFVPHGLNTEQWSKLLSGHELAKGQTTEPLLRNPTIPVTLDPTFPPDDSSLWDVAVMSAADEAVLPQVTLNDKENGRTKEVIATLQRTLPSLAVLTNQLQLPESAILALASPSEAMYFAMQWARLEQSQEPVDHKGMVIAKEGYEREGRSFMLALYYHPAGRRVASGRIILDRTPAYHGVRPAVRARDFLRVKPSV